MFGDFGSHLGVPAIGGPIGNRATMLRALRQEPTPGAKPPHTTIPAAVTADDGALRYVLGVAGGFMQPQAQVQLLVRMLVEAMAPQEAIDAARFKVLFGGDVAAEPGHPLLVSMPESGERPPGPEGFGAAQVVGWHEGVLLAGSRCPPRRPRRGDLRVTRALAGPPKFFGLAVLPSGEVVAATFGAGVVRTSGGAWEAVAKLSALSTNAVLRTSSGAVLVGTNGRGLFRSWDTGGSWTPVDAGPDTVYALAEGDALYAGTAGEGVWRSGDDGMTWTPVAGGPSPRSRVYALAARPDGMIVAGTDGAGLWRSGGATDAWRQVGPPGITVHALVDDVTTMFAGCSGQGVLRSSDGETWTTASTGLDDLHVHCLAVDGGDTLLAGTGAGVFCSRDGGATWSAANAGMGRLPDLLAGAPR